MSVCGEVGAEGNGAGNLLSQAEQAAAVSEVLRRTLEEERHAAVVLARHLGDLTADLRMTSRSLVKADALDQNYEQKIPCPTLVARCHTSGRLRPLSGHEALAMETLARMAAQLAGRDPDQRLLLKLAGVVAFDDHAWRYPDFIQRAERAFDALAPSVYRPRNDATHGDLGSIHRS